jgi:tetratricopeptide (TPR) repeat protein
VFLVSGVAGSLASAAAAERLSVGASGAIFGLLGASIVFAFRFRNILPPRVARIMGPALLPWVALNVVFGFLVPRVDMNAHLGGLAFGAILALGVTPRSLLPVLAGTAPGAPAGMRAVCISLLVVSFVPALGSVLATRGKDGPVLPAWQLQVMGRMERDVVQEIVEERLQDTPDAPDLLRVRGGLRIEAEDWAGAIQDYDAVLAADPRDAEALNNLAWLLLEQAPASWRDRPRAADLARRALEVAPDNPFVLGTYGTALLREGRPAEAADFLRRALEGGARDGDATDRYLLAIALAGAGEAEEARRQLERAVRRDPADAYRREAERAVADGATHIEPAP